MVAREERGCLEEFVLFIVIIVVTAKRWLKRIDISVCLLQILLVLEGGHIVGSDDSDSR